MVLSCERVCGRARTMLRRVVEARTKKSGRLSFSDSALRHSRRRWSRACCSGVRDSVGSGVVRARASARVELAEVPLDATVEEDLAKCGGPFGKLRAGFSTSAAKSAAFGRDDGSFP